jgi:uncharacterized protein (DUF1778 family)
MPKETQIQIRVTHEDKKLISEAAAKAGHEHGASGWLRDLAVKAAKKQTAR